MDLSFINALLGSSVFLDVLPIQKTIAAWTVGASAAVGLVLLLIMYLRKRKGNN